MGSLQERDSRSSAAMNLLHVGAGLHAHEYSPPTAPSTSSRPPRMPFRSYSSPSQPLQSVRPTSYQDSTKITAPNIASPAYIRPARRLSNSRRRTTSERVSFLDKTIDIRTRSMTSAIYDDSSDDGMSVASSTFSGSAASLSVKEKTKRAVKHPQTKYYLAGPAPTLTHKQRLIHLRPRMVLQLQRIPLSGRPVPILEVRSSSTFVPRIAKKFPGLYKGSGQLGINDVMICKSENYHDATVDEYSLTQASCGTDAYDENEVIAVICQAPKDSGFSGELCFDDSTRWTMASGKGRSFELTKTDNCTGEAVVCRWVPSGASRRSSFQTPASKQTRNAVDVAKGAKDEKYTFSIIDPSRRRHPVMATLKQTGLVMKDTYSPTDSSTPASSASISPPTAGLESNTSPELPYSADGLTTYPSLANPTILRTTEAQKLLIEISAVWLASRLGWCPWSDALHPVPASHQAPGPKSPARQRSSTLNPSSGSASKHKRGRSGTVSSIAEGSVHDTAEGARSPQGSLTRRSSLFKRTSLNNAVFHHSDSDHTPPKTTPLRAVSTGAAFMQRQAEKRSSRPPSEAGSRCGSTTASINNSRPNSPRRACSVDMLSGLGNENKHGEALSKGLLKYESKRSSLPAGVRRANSDFEARGGAGMAGREGSLHCRIGEAMRSEVTTEPVLLEESRKAVELVTREGGKGLKEVENEALPRRAKTLPSSRARREEVAQGCKEREEGKERLQGEKRRVGKMKVFMGFFSSRQRAANREVRGDVYN